MFSLSSGVIHTYYTVAIAPPAAVLATAIWSWVLLDRTPQWESWLRAVVLVSAALAVAGLVAGPAVRRFGRRVTIATAVTAAVACLGGPVAYSAQTITTAHTGSIPSAGPSAASGLGFGGGGRQGGGVSSAVIRALEDKRLPLGGGSVGLAECGSPGGPAGSGGRGAPGAPASTTSAITAWVKAHYKSVTLGGQTVYDLTQPLA